MVLISKKQLKKNKQKELSTHTEQEFLAKAEDFKPEVNPDLTNLSIDELAFRFIEIDQQSHLLKGRILLEARSRFLSDKEFGQWVSTHSLCVGSQQSRNRLMHLADFFGSDRDMTGINITAASELRAPANSDRALSVYKKVYGKNLSVKEVKALLIEKSIKQVEKKNRSQTIKNEVQLLAIKIVDKVMSGKTDTFKLDVLQNAINYINNKK